MRFINTIISMLLAGACVAVFASCSERPENTRKGNLNSQGTDPANQSYTIDGVTGIKSADDYHLCSTDGVDVSFYRYGSEGAEFRLVNNSDSEKYVECVLIALDGTCYSDTEQYSELISAGDVGSLSLDFPDEIKPKKLRVRFCCYDENYDLIYGSVSDAIEIERDTTNWLAPRTPAEAVYSDSSVTIESTGFTTDSTYDTVGLKFTNNTDKDVIYVVFDPSCPEGDLTGRERCTAPAGGSGFMDYNIYSEVDPSYLLISVNSFDMEERYNNEDYGTLFSLQDIAVPITAEVPVQPEPEEPEEPEQPEKPELTLTEYEEDLLRGYINAGFEELSPISAELDGGSPVAVLDDGQVAVQYVSAILGNDDIEGDMLVIFLKVQNDNDEIIDGTAQCTVNGITLPSYETEAVSRGESKLIKLYYPMSSMNELFGELSDICFDISFIKTSDLVQEENIGNTGLFTLRFTENENRPDLTEGAKEIYSDGCVSVYERGIIEDGYRLIIDLYTVNKTEQPVFVKLDEPEMTDSELSLWLFGSVLNIPAGGGGLMTVNVGDLNSGNELSAEMAAGLAMNITVLDSWGEQLSEGEAVL